MTASAVVVLHPGAMGVSVSRTLANGGHPVRWVAAGRSEATRRRAQRAGLTAAASLEHALDGAMAVVSVCPPDRALEVAEAVAGSGFRGRYMDANAVSPATARRLQDLLGDALVDGGIVGPPAERPGTTRVYLSGAAAGEAAAWFAAGPLEARVLEGQPVGAASALKMCYAAWTKGSAALLLAVRALARAESVTGDLLAEWAISQPGLAQRAEATARGTAPKAWRFAGEMEEIAATFEAVGLPEGFHSAAAELYRRLEDLRDREASLDDVLALLLRG